MGFFGKAALFQSGIATNSLAFVGLVFLGSGLSFIYMFRTYQRSFWTAIDEKEAGWSSGLPVVLVIAGSILLLGVFPEPLLAASRLAAASLMGTSP